VLLEAASEVERLGAILAKHRLAGTKQAKQKIVEEAAELVGFPDATFAELQLILIASRNCLEVKKRGLDSTGGRSVLYEGRMEGRVLSIHPKLYRVFILTEMGKKLVSPFQLEVVRK
jgi:hypothetical protein